MEKFINSMLKFTVNYIRENATIQKPIKNQDLDLVLQEEFKLKKQLGDGRIRVLIHDCRLYVDILDDEGQRGWLCANAEGYFVCYSPSVINAWAASFFSKINQMMKVYEKSHEVLSEKTFYKQGNLFDAD